MRRMTQPQQQTVIHVPDELVAGTYSNVVAVWHTPYEFTLDFAVTLPTQLHTNDAGEAVAVVPARVVSRVKLPPSAVFALMQALSHNEARYVEHNGPITRPGNDPPLYPPADPA